MLMLIFICSWAIENGKNRVKEYILGWMWAVKNVKVGQFQVFPASPDQRCACYHQKNWFLCTA
jgi:hypothetical protein